MCVFQFPLTFCPHKKEQNCYRQKRFRASKYTKNAVRPDPAVGAYSAAPDPLAGFGEGREEGGEREEKRKGGEGRKRGKGWPPETAGLDPPLIRHDL